MAIVTLFISAVLGLLWLLEVNAAQFLSPAMLAAAEAAGAAALYSLFIRMTVWRKNKPAQTEAELERQDDSSAILVVYATQTGVAVEIAERTARALEQGGRRARLIDISVLDISELKNAQTALFIASTTGEGDPPDTAIRFLAREMAAPAGLSHLRYGVLALGDKNYRDFCAFGRRLDHWLTKSGAVALFQRIDVDRGDEEAIGKWFATLEELSGAGETNASGFETWRLEERRLLNSGSENPPVFHVSLKPSGVLPSWCAGDIAVVAPHNDPNSVERILNVTGLDGNTLVVLRDKTMSLREALVQLTLLEADELAAMRNVEPQALVDALRPMPPREYSLASLPADGKAELVVRQMRHPDGRLGAGSGWLTEHASQGSAIEMRLRRNPSFHGPEDDRPIILISAGSGVAGLRAHMKERIAAGRRQNWLIFGERSIESDYLFRDEIEGWRASGALARLDLCFMDDGEQRLVQDVLRDEKSELRRWLKNGAAIYVSGSRARVGDGVGAALKRILGEESVSKLIQQFRYKSDVY